LDGLDFLLVVAGEALRDVESPVDRLLEPREQRLPVPDGLATGARRVRLPLLLALTHTHLLSPGKARPWPQRGERCSFVAPRTTCDASKSVSSYAALF